MLALEEVSMAVFWHGEASRVERHAAQLRHRVLRLLEKRGALPAQGPEDALQVYQAHSPQRRLRWTEVDVRPPPRKQPRCAFLEGFSLHANTHPHANDRQGLERLCRYGARGALALERLSRRTAPVSRPPRHLRSSPHPQHGLYPAYTHVLLMSFPSPVWSFFCSQKPDLVPKMQAQPRSQRVAP